MLDYVTVSTSYSTDNLKVILVLVKNEILTDEKFLNYIQSKICQDFWAEGVIIQPINYEFNISNYINVDDYILCNAIISYA